MLRSFLLMMLMVGGLSVYGQQATPAKKACNISQCQARKTSTASTSTTSATTATTVAQTTATAPDRATAPVVSACNTKALAIPTSLQLKALVSDNKSAENCDPKNCDPTNCIPRSCNTEAKMTTTLAAKQE